MGLDPVHGASPHAGIARAFGPAMESRIFLSAEGAANTSLGRSPRKVAQKIRPGLKACNILCNVYVNNYNEAESDSGSPIGNTRTSPVKGEG